MRTAFRKLLNDRRGATAIEYGLIASLIVVVAVGGFQALGGGNGGLWGNFTTRAAAAMPTA